MRPYVPGESLSAVSVNAEDTPGIGGMIAWNPANKNDQWYIAKEFFENNYEEAIPRPMTIPTVGRVVHYVSYGTPNGEYRPEHRAAIVTEVDEFNYLSLCVLNPTGMFFNVGIGYDPTGNIGGTWHWPELV